MSATVDTDEDVRTCALCQERIASGCPNTLEHVLAQRNHYWDCLQRVDLFMERQAGELTRVSRSARRRALHEQAQWLYEQAKASKKQHDEHESHGDKPEAAYYIGMYDAFTAAAMRAHRMAEGTEP